MSVGVTSGNTSVTGTVTVSGTVANKNVTVLADKRTTTGTTTLGTVGAGKIWRIVGATISCAYGNSGYENKILANSAVISQMNVIGNVASQTTTLTKKWDYTCAPQIAAGQTVTFSTDGSCTTAVTVDYVEEAA